ncbi:hypothetical protein CDAR_386591 [Caerostris darwini]|uniref:Uncharacterized protein n=1 Tax=Caerostris darwini TaxID=1538125 RepID=A0AAV4X762_9ARAC|nr:hypothetical protein CDAR_386591 [Caerostris darwini]
MSENNVNEVTMEDSTPEVNNDEGPKTTTQNSTGPRPVSPSGVKISDDFVYENFQLISELHVFQSQLEYLHNCMQAASSNDKDNQCCRIAKARLHFLHFWMHRPPSKWPEMKDIADPVEELSEATDIIDMSGR